MFGVKLTLILVVSLFHVITTTTSNNEYVTNELGEFIFPKKEYGESDQLQISFGYAVDYCKIRGMSLVEVRTPEMQKFLVSQMVARQDHGMQFWLGMKREKFTSEYKYLTDGGTVQLTYWRSGTEISVTDSDMCAVCEFDQETNECEWWEFGCGISGKAICHRPKNDTISGPLKNWWKGNKLYNFYFN